MHLRILEHYTKLIGVTKDQIDTWWPIRYNSIRVRLKNKKEFMFTYTSKTRWKLETYALFMDNYKKMMIRKGK